MFGGADQRQLTEEGHRRLDQNLRAKLDRLTEISGQQLALYQQLAEEALSASSTKSPHQELRDLAYEYVRYDAANDEGLGFPTGPVAFAANSRIRSALRGTRQPLVRRRRAPCRWTWRPWSRPSGLPTEGDGLIE